MTIELPSYSSSKDKKDNTQSIDIWHNKLGHVHHQIIKQMEAMEMVDGLVLSGRGEDLAFYVGCACGKNHIKFFPWKERQEKTKKIGHLVHYDLLWTHQPTHYWWSKLFCFVQG